MDRLEEWRRFSKQVELHIEQYANVQYGSEEGNDQATNFSVRDCWENMKRYFNRRESNVRGINESLRDVIKIAHYGCMLYNKIKKENHLEGDLYEPEP